MKPSLFVVASAITAHQAAFQPNNVRDIFSSGDAASKSQKRLTNHRTNVLCLTFKSRVEAMKR